MTVKHCVFQELLGLAGEVSAFIAKNSAGITKTGAKYLSDELLKAAGSDLKSQLSSTLVDVGPQSMATLYAQAVALDLFPHLFLCLEAVYSSSSHKIVERVRNFKLKYLVGHFASRTTVPRQMTHLVASAAQGGELLGKLLFARLNEVCWRPFQSAGLLFVMSEVEFLKPQPVHLVTRVDSAPIPKPGSNNAENLMELNTVSATGASDTSNDKGNVEG